MQNEKMKEIEKHRFKQVADLAGTLILITVAFFSHRLWNFPFKAGFFYIPFFFVYSFCTIYRGIKYTILLSFIFFIITHYCYAYNKTHEDKFSSGDVFTVMHITRINICFSALHVYVPLELHITYKSESF